MLLPPGSFPLCGVDLFAVVVLHAENLLCCSLPQHSGAEGCSAEECRALITSLSFLVMCFKRVQLLFLSSCLQCGVALVVQGLHCQAGCVFLIGDNLRSWCGDAGYWGEARDSPAPSGAPPLSLLARAHPLLRLTLCFPLNRRTNATLPTSTKSSPGSRWSSHPRTNSSS